MTQEEIDKIGELLTEIDSKIWWIIGILTAILVVIILK